MNLSRSEIHALRADRAALARCVREIREVCGMPDVPLVDLPGMIGDVLASIALDKAAAEQIIDDVLDDIPAMTVDELLEDFEPADQVVPMVPHQCAGCHRLNEIDGRLNCCEPRSGLHHSVIVWPGPGCEWRSCQDQIYGG